MILAYIHKEVLKVCKTVPTDWVCVSLKGLYPQQHLMHICSCQQRPLSIRDFDKPISIRELRCSHTELTSSVHWYKDTRILLYHGQCAKCGTVYYGIARQYVRPSEFDLWNREQRAKKRKRKRK